MHACAHDGHTVAAKAVGYVVCGYYELNISKHKGKAIQSKPQRNIVQLAVLKYIFKMRFQITMKC